MLKCNSNGFFPKSIKILKNISFKNMEHHPHWHRNAQSFLNETLPQRCLGRKGPQDLALHLWLCDFFSWRCIKDIVFVQQLASFHN